MNKIIKTIATQNKKSEATVKYYVAYAYEIEHTSLLQFRVFKIDLGTCQIDNSDYLDVTFNLQEIRQPEGEDDILSPLTVSKFVKKTNIKIA